MAADRGVSIDPDMTQKPLTDLDGPASCDGFLDDRWDNYLRGPRMLPGASSSQLRVLDLFSGIGGLALGVERAAVLQGYRFESIAAVDQDERALEIYRANFDTTAVLSRSVANLIDYQIRGRGETARFLYQPVLQSELGSALAGGVDVVLAGPPCQGHSNLNNRTRGDDPRNRLYLTVPAIAIAAGARLVVIENVPGVVRSRGNVVETAEGLLKSAGYSTTSAILAADKLGWPQTRKRFFLVAVRESELLPLEQFAARQFTAPRPLSWAVGDLLRRSTDGRDPLHSTAILSEENQARIAWLFANGEFNTPAHLRPDCHKNGTTYGAVYGRMRWDQPAPTLTTGFLTPGRGRFIHPLRPRTLTSREAARVQGFPDWFDFTAGGKLQPTRTDLAKWIGNAVPPILGYTAISSAIQSPSWGISERRPAATSVWQALV